MTDAQALARLIDNAPELAGEVMPEGFGIDEYGVYDAQSEDPYAKTSPRPSWFYQAVAGKLTEWLASQRTVVRQGRVDGDWFLDSPKEHRHLRDATTYFAALVEAAISVHNAA